MPIKSTVFFLLLVCFAGAADAQVRITDGSLEANTDYTWTANNEYLLDGLVYLEAGSTLNIEAGTVIRGATEANITTSDNTSALIITQGARILALGTALKPVIFTAEEDDLTDGGDFTPIDRGEWGGLIILGRARIARPGGMDRIEGVDPNENRVIFGGGENPDDNDDSGILNYVSIRHGGAVLADGDEINGLTLGGVGSGTTIDYIEVFANDDDGIEFFGGTVNVSHATVAYCKDDSYDWDFGWRGKGQYWFSIQAPNSTTGHAGEHDGASPDDQAPFAQPTIFNATYVGIGKDAFGNGGDVAEDPIKAILMRDNTGGSYNNSIFTDFNGIAVAIEDRTNTTTVDAFARLQAGDLSFNNNYFWNFGGGATAADLFKAIDESDNEVAASSAIVATNFTAAGNLVTNPELNQMDRDTDGNGIDPRPFAFGAAATGAPAPTDDYFEAQPYYGAFAPGNGNNNQAWITGWTALDVTGGFDNDFLNNVGRVEQSGLLLDAPVPNPAASLTRINFDLPTSMQVELTVLDLTGRPLAYRSGHYAAGPQTETLDVTDLPSGNYVIILRAAGKRLLQKLVVTK